MAAEIAITRDSSGEWRASALARRRYTREREPVIALSETGPDITTALYNLAYALAEAFVDEAEGQ